MHVSVRANVRTAHEAWKDIRPAFDVALRAGSVMGFGLVSIGDLTKAMQHNLCQEVREHSNYIGGPYLS